MNTTHSTPASTGDRIWMSYLLWLFGFTGLAGLHRLYNGKIGTGLLWLFTGGLLGVGQVIDLFLVPDMAEEQRVRLLRRAGAASYGVGTQPIATQTVPQFTQQQGMLKLLKAAQRNKGKLTVTQAVLATELSFVEVETLLREMMKLGYVSIENDPHTGVIVYYFVEL
ncbi:MAG: TM2 domain-containing protein [Leptolyngbyaceae cyanobacterium SL_7_1]|nr:TM2 domain-containing protein [Leptolyngbyaceae cyanobacterium SL_7_1]